LGAIGGVREILTDFKVDIGVWIIIFLVGLFVAQFLAFHNIRVDRDNLLNKAKPKLNIEKVIESIRGRYTDKSLNIEVLNIGSDDSYFL
jgi:hypothetical protein